MGFYDGVSVNTTMASSYELAKITGTPVILIVNCKGKGLSIIPIIQGFLQFRKDNNIKGVILNQLSRNLYEDLKKQIENMLNIKVLGYVPKIKELAFESRHLGLVKPDEITGLHTKSDKLAKLFEETIELNELLKIAQNTSDLIYRRPEIPGVEGRPVIAFAKDEAFCFYYEDNLAILREMGAKLVGFSPLHDIQLPQNIDGLLLGGGYPEIYAGELSSNNSMRKSIKNALINKMPCIAECGGFMYLHDTMEDMEGKAYPMAGFINGKVYKTNRRTE